MSEEIKRVITIEDEATPALDNIKTSAEAAAGGLDEVSVNLESFKKAGDQFKDGLDDVSEGLDRIVPGSKDVIEGVTKLGKAFKALLKNPIGIALTAIVTVIGSLTLAIKKNDKAVAALSKAAKAFEPVLQVFSNLIEKIATGIAKVVEGIGNWVTKLFGLKSGISDAAREQKILNDEIERGKEVNKSAVDQYADAYSKFTEILSAYGKIESKTGKDRKKSIKDFLSTYKSSFEELSKYSSKFSNSILELKTAEDVDRIFKSIRDNSAGITSELYKSGRALLDTESKSKQFAKYLQDALNVNIDEDVVLQKRAKELYERIEKLKEKAKNATDKGTSQEISYMFGQEEAKLKQLYSEYQDLKNAVISELEDALKNAATLAGENGNKIWTNLIGNGGYSLKVLKNLVVNEIKELYNESADAVGAVKVDLSGLGEDTAGAIDELIEKLNSPGAKEKRRIDLLPVIDLQNVEIEDLGIDSVFDEFKYTLEEKTNRLLEETPIKNPLEALFEISSEQLNNLDQYSNAYFEKAKEVENVGWQIEEARLQREGYTNEQIEALRREHNKRLENIDKEQISATLSNIGVYSDAISSLGSGLISIIEATTEEGEDSFEKTKGLQVAVATIDTLSGVMGAWTSALNSGIPAPYSFILGGIQSAAVLATGIANVAKIKNTKIGGGGSVSSATPSTPANTYNPTYTANVTGQSDIDLLQKTIESGTSNAVDNIQVYITETQLEESRNNRQVKISESTW